MSMYDGLDLSRFRRVGADKKTVTLRHNKGHEIKIAHSALTPKMREKIDGLAQHDDTVKVYAEGTPDEPVSADDGAPEVSIPQTPAPAEAAPTLAPAPQAQPTSAPAPQAMPPPKPAVIPSGGEVVVTGARKPPPIQPVQMAMQMDMDDQAFAQDMQMGHIKPETYQSLFAKKDTLGKIGTLFGLLVGGAGSGLTKSPNVILEMMDKVIQNDLEAQKASNTNAQNWYNLSNQRAMQQAQQARMQVENMATMMGLQKIPAEMAVLQAQANMYGVDASLKSTQNAENMMRLAAMQQLLNQMNMLPPGPQKDTMQNFYNQMNEAVNLKNAAGNLNVSDQIGARAKLRGESEPTEQNPHDSGFDQGKFDDLVNQSRVAQSMNLPSPVNERDLTAIEDESRKLASNRQAAKQYQAAFKQLDSMVAGGKLNEEMYKGVTGPAKAEISRALTGVFSPSHAEEVAESAFPSWKDYNGSRKTKYQTFMGMLEGNEAQLTKLKQYGLVKPSPYFKKKGGEKKGGETKAPPKLEEAKIKEGQTAGGGKYVFRGGKWVENTKQAAK